MSSSNSTEIRSTMAIRSIPRGDWESINYNIRYLNERLSQLDGFSGESKKFSITNMESNKIVSGPINQIRADGDEFITRDYLKSKEAATIYGNTVKSGGLSPIILSPSQPGSETIGSGGDDAILLPKFLIYGGATDSVFTDFRPATRQWIPVWGDKRYCSFSYNGSGGVDLIYSSTGVQFPETMTGIVPRFKLFPDSNTGKIVFRVKFNNVLWSFGSDTYAKGPIRLGVFVYSGPGAIFEKWGEWTSIGVDYSVSPTDSFISWDGYINMNQDIHAHFHLTPYESRGASPLGEVSLRGEYTWRDDGLGSNITTRHNEIYYDINGAGWTAEGIGSQPGTSPYLSLGDQNHAMRGLNLFIGLFGDGGNFNATITEFAVEQGILGYSF